MPCDHTTHGWKIFDVEGQWMPDSIRCLIVGESPGLLPNSEYFYEKRTIDKDDKVGVRCELLAGLTTAKLIAEPTLEAFKEARFLFDHAVRCIFPKKETTALRADARNRKLAFPAPQHLAKAVDAATTVWIMGNIARVGVASIRSDFAHDGKLITDQCYYPGRYNESKFFVSRYFTHLKKGEGKAICQKFATFLHDFPA